MSLQTEFDFELPKGYADEMGNLYRKGTMRLATAADEILPLKDPRVMANPAYLSIILLSRVVIRLGDLSDSEINPRIIEGLFVSDVAYLQELYNRINGNGDASVKAVCPKCEHSFNIEVKGQGEY